MEQGRKTLEQFLEKKDIQSFSRRLRQLLVMNDFTLVNTADLFAEMRKVLSVQERIAISCVD